MDPHDAASALASMVSEEIGQLRSAKLTPAKRATEIGRLSRILRDLGLLTGEGLTESQVMKAPAAARVLDAVTEALTGHPAALVAVRDALARLKEARS